MLKRSCFFLFCFIIFIGLSSCDAQNNPGQVRHMYKSIAFLNEISGKKTVAGIHNREPNDSPQRWTNQIFKLTGKYPGLWSGDFLFQSDNITNRQVMISEALRQWNNGALVNIMWHACNPALTEPCGWDSAGVLSRLSDKEWKELITDGTVLNRSWKSRVDEICPFLESLRKNGVEVLWRPMHEMNQRAFWWGGRPGQDGTRKLYQMLHDYMVKEKGLTNLVWIWDLQDFPGLKDDIAFYDPGDGYWDIAALDVYDKTGFTKGKYDMMMTAARGKPLAIGECDRLPTANQLLAQPAWVFFMGWSELVFSTNTKREILDLFQSPMVVTLDNMPGWGMKN